MRGLSKVGVYSIKATNKVEETQEAIGQLSLTP
jgi:hypothetical protein